MKTLYFEGAGCVPRGDVENCRIRTAFTNDEGKKIYLELTGSLVSEKSPIPHRGYANMGFVDHCHYITGDIDDCNINRLPCERRKHYEYSKAGILEFVNSELNCSFEDIKATDSFYGYRVHRDGGGYNFMEEHTFDEEHAERARTAYNDIDMKIRERLGEKYSKIGLVSISDNHIVIRCYASDKAMQAAGLEQRIMRIEI